MIKIAERIAYKEKAKALLTGDSLGQVSSQTLGNLYVTHQCSVFPLFCVMSLVLKIWPAASSLASQGSHKLRILTICDA